MRKILFVLLLCLLLSGCSMGQIMSAPSRCRVVTQVAVTAARHGAVTNHHYTQPEKMEQFLNYLRLLQPHPPVDVTPETFRADAYEITLTLSDGNRTVYRQLHDQYLQCNGGKWQKIDPKLGSRLSALLDSLPEDPQPYTMHSALAFPAALAYNRRTNSTAGGAIHESLEAF